MTHQKRTSHATPHPTVHLALLCAAIVLTGLLAACNAEPSQPPSATGTEQAALPTEALVTFRVSLPSPLPPGDSIYIAILDEVTGLAFNAQKFVMQAEDATHYTASIPFPMGSVIKYRYTRGGSSLAQEHVTDGRAVRYRLLHVEGPGIYEDIVARWTDTQYNGLTGRVTGQVTDIGTGQPIQNILICAGGLHALTVADGTFLLEGIPPGTHNLVAYSLNGSYQVFQQGATVAADSSTPATISLSPAPMVAITFVTTTPSNTPPRATLRLAGNLYQLGNTFSDLSGGVSTIASRMPILSQQPDGRYAITLLLPSGADLRYKYTLGDGLWNTEYSADGALQLRQLIVPSQDTQIIDTIETWQTPDQEPISFQVSIPHSTPEGEAISIQLNPGYGWLEPIPMWVHDTDRFTWQYTLFNPLRSITTLSYRYCRQEQCGRADDQATSGYLSPGRTLTISSEPATVQDVVQNWMWPDISTPAVVPNLTIHSRGPEFVAGVALTPDYHPTWSTRLPEAISHINNLSTNLIIFAPTWTFSRQNLPVLELLPSQDILWGDLNNSITQARALGLNVGLFPSPHFPYSPDEWWQTATRDFSWWVTWFDRYRSFANHHASLATSANAQVLVFGGEWLTPALPGGQLADGNPSNLPQDAEERWRSIIQEVRSRYNGTLAWALPYSHLQTPPPFLDLFDQIYILWDSVPLASSEPANESEMQAAAMLLMDEQILPIYQQTGKPIILAVSYPSADGAAFGCTQSLAEGDCPSTTPYQHQGWAWAGEAIDLQEQVAIFNAIFMAINERDWISGFVSTEYYPASAIQDSSASVHGKPASGVLWFWFPALLQSP